MRALGIAIGLTVAAIGLYNVVKYERKLVVDNNDAELRRQIRDAIKINDDVAITDLIHQLSDDGLQYFASLYRHNNDSSFNSILHNELLLRRKF